MKIYFGCSRSALEEEPSRYLTILQFLKANYNCELARSWVERSLNDISCGLSAPSYELLGDEILHDIDTADFAIFEVTQKSMGLGQQLMYALDQKKPTLILNDLSISRPVRDIFIITKNHKPILGEYHSPSEMIEHIAHFMNKQERCRHKRMTLELDASLHREIDRLANIECCSRRDIIEDYIRKYRDRKNRS